MVTEQRTFFIQSSNWLPIMCQVLLWQLNNDERKVIVPASQTYNIVGKTDVKQVNTYRITNCVKCYDGIAQRVVRENNKDGAVTFSAVYLSVLPLTTAT